MADAFYKSHQRHPGLFGDKFEESWLHPDLKDLVKAFGGSNASFAEDPTKLAPDLLREEAPQVYSFKCLSPLFLQIFNEEIENFYEITDKYNIPVRRPNSMNKYGVIVNEIGMRPLITSFQQNYLWPLARVLFPSEGSQFDDHHSFIVRYRADEDLGLDMHTDDSDVTFNVCLGHDFVGATLSFCGMFGAVDHRKWVHTYRHEIGRAILHLGSRRHGADDIESGMRANLIVWNHNHEYRNSIDYRRTRRSHVLYQKEEGPPDPVCLSYTHDRDFANFKAVPDSIKEKSTQAWCPPPGKEYDGFKG
jgi:hypothetical protein|eukprot:CAMPEP_0198293658 /NCGR_PEP_ID=MMETSP1449-20131203/18281_1 /TAXON_ID=420275 /ORGANISM="Attheya septentrionalis, Strain CCMP2084" /LENGTH=304 /DNA_ID=CAMNT_0043993323 /DNA_START=169 /DNA_END=1083 /DNA_ORIENTATION=-